MARRALVIGISKYKPPQVVLKGVARDTEAIGKVLQSDKAGFTDAVTILPDEKATLSAVRTALAQLLGKSKKSDEVLLFMAGHGVRIKGKGYFCTIDTVVNDPVRTGLPLSELRGLFDACKSQRVVLFLDFCYSGAVTARSPNASIAVPRELTLVQGKGRVIICACSDTEQANESRNGHGWFTKSILDGLKGQAKNPQGDVTIGSLFDHTVHQVQVLGESFGKKQTPRLSGDIEGKFSIVHYAKSRQRAEPEAKTQSEKATPPAAKPTVVAKTPRALPVVVKWIPISKAWSLLEGLMVKTFSVTEPDGERIELVARGVDPSVSAKLRTLRAQHFSQVRFVYGGMGCNAQLVKAVPNTSGGVEEWSISLLRRPSPQNEFGTTGVSADQIAEMKARKILLGQEIPTEVGFLVSAFSGRDDYVCPLGTLKAFKPPVKDIARVQLECVFLLCTSGAVEHVLDLGFQVNDRSVKVRFKGQRRGQVIQFTGTYRRK